MFFRTYFHKRWVRALENHTGCYIIHLHVAQTTSVILSKSLFQANSKLLHLGNHLFCKYIYIYIFPSKFQNVKKKTMAQTIKKERESNISIKCKEVIRHWIKTSLIKSHRVAVCLFPSKINSINCIFPNGCYNLVPAVNSTKKCSFRRQKTFRTSSIQNKYVWTGSK